MLEGIAEALSERGWSMTPGFLDAGAARDLRAHLVALDAQGALHPASIGRGAGKSLRPDIRGDRIAWLEPDDPAPAVQAALSRLETLRQTLNRTLYLGLRDAELHLALYPPSGFY